MSTDELDTIRSSLWKLYELLEILRVVSGQYTKHDGPVSIDEDNEFVTKFGHISDLGKHHHDWT